LHDKDGSKNLGIYVFEGDQFLICIGESEKPRPTEFTTKTSTGHSLIRFKRAPREDEVREVVDKFFKAALAGDAEKTRALAAPAVSDQQLARFKGLAKTLAVAKVHVTPGPAPTSQGANNGRALVVSEEVEVVESRGKTKGRIVLTLLKDDVRIKSKGWLIWDVDLRDQGGVDQEMQAFIDRNMKLERNVQAELDKAALTAWGKEVGGLQAGLGYHPGPYRVPWRDLTRRDGCQRKCHSARMASHAWSAAGLGASRPGAGQGNRVSRIEAGTQTFQRAGQQDAPDLVRNGRVSHSVQTG
jgi:hypothetical protein